MTSGLEKRKAVRAEWVRRLGEMDTKKRMDEMLEEVDGRALVQSIPGEDVYSSIIDVGLADSTEIVQLSTPEQFRTYVDLASWSKDRIDVLEVLRWIRAARGDDDEAFLKKLEKLDLEVLELLYKRTTNIHDLEEDPDVNPAGITMETPEGKFLVEFTVDGIDEAAMRKLTQDITARNPFELARFLEAVRWELPTELEEAAYQFRTARLQDIGFPPFDEAIRLFAFVDPKQFSKSGPVATTDLSKGAFIDFVEAAFRGLESNERETLAAEVRYLVNSFLVAEAAEPGDPKAIRRLSEHARDYLNLGLEHLCGGDPTFASDAVREHELKRVFQIGFSLTLKLKRQVERMAGEVGAKMGETWLALDDEAATLTSLMKRRPLKALRVPGADPVPFRCKRELEETEAILSRVRAQRAIFGRLLGQNPSETIGRFVLSLTELTPQRLFAAVVAHAEISATLMVQPFAELQLTELCERLFEEDQSVAKIRTSAGRRALTVLTAEDLSVGEEAKHMVDRTLQKFLSDFGANYIQKGRVEAKSIQCLPIQFQ